MSMHRKTRAAVLILTASLFALPAAQAADLKQLAEQLVNLTVKEQAGPQGQGGATKPKGIREGGRTVGAGQRASSAQGAQRPAGIAIQEEGANVKKEKGVEDVE